MEVFVVVGVCINADESVEIAGSAEVKVAAAGAIKGPGPQLVRNSSVPARATIHMRLFSLNSFFVRNQ